MDTSTFNTHMSDPKKNYSHLKTLVYCPKKFVKFLMANPHQDIKLLFMS